MKYKNNKNSKNSKLRSLGIVGCSSLLALSAFSLGAPYAIYAPAQVMAQSIPYSAQTVDNGDFTSTSTSSYPQSANNWTKLSENSGIKAGVISLSDSAYSTNYEEYGLFKTNELVMETNDALKDTSVFMMNSMENQAIYGIESNAISLDANSNYILSVKVRTNLPILKDGDKKIINNTASVYLTIDNKEVMSKTEISTSSGSNIGDWVTYYFFVKTKFNGSSNAKMQLYLGSKDTPRSGAVLFDSVQCIKCTNDFYDSKNVEIDNKYKVQDKDANYAYVSPESIEDATYFSKVDATSLLADSTFADSSKWTKATNGSDSIINSGIILASDNYVNSYDMKTTPGTNNITTDNHVLAMNILQDDDKSASVTYTSEEFTLSRYTNYKFQFYVKTKDVAGAGLHASIVPEDSKYTAVTLSSITSSTQSITNDWTLCSIYIKGDSFADIKAKLEFGLGSVKDKTSASGLAFVDDITIYKVSYEEYAGVETSSTITKGALSSTSTTSDSKIANANFDIVADTAGDSIPFAPANWTASNTYNTTSGIINNKHYTGSKIEYGNLSWDGIGLTSAQSFIDINIPEELAIANQNLLMINTADTGYQSYKSESVQLNASTLYKLSVDARNSSASDAYITLNFGEDMIYSTKVVQSNEFNLYDIYFITPMNSVHANIEIGLGTQSDIVLNGYAFFDNIYLTDLTDSSDKSYTPESKLESLQKDDDSIIGLNLKNDYFSHIEDSSNAEGLYSSRMWDTSSEGGVTSGINTTNSSLMISSVNQNTDFKVETKYQHKLDSSKYYKVSFTLFTSDFTSLDANANGAVVGFNERDAAGEYFEHIISNTDATYTFYIKASELTDITPYVKLVTTNSNEEQYVQLTGLTIEEVSDATFKAKQTELENDSTINNVIILGEVEEEETVDPDSQTGNYSPDISVWSWVIPTIATCLAIILAVIGLIVKKINKKASKKSKKYSNNYDRESTIHKSIIDKEVEKLRQQKIDEVKKKLLATQEKLQTLEDNYKEKTSDESVNKEAEYKKLVRSRKKHAQKEVELKEELDYLQSDDYTDTVRAQVIEDAKAKFDEDNVIEKDDVIEEVVDNTTPSTEEVIIEAQETNKEENNTDNNSTDKK